MYISPVGDFGSFITLLDSCLSHLLRILASHIVLCGDLNVHLECPSHDEVIFSNLLRSYGLYTTSVVPTRGSACLDAIATNIDSWDWKVEIAYPCCSGPSNCGSRC